MREEKGDGPRGWGEMGFCCAEAMCCVLRGGERQKEVIDRIGQDRLENALADGSAARGSSRRWRA